MLINLVLPGDPHCISLAVSPVCLGAATCVGVHRSRAAVLTSQRGSGCLVTVPVWQISVQSVTVQVWQSLSQCGSHCPSVAVTVPVWQIYVQSLSQCGRSVFSHCPSVADLCSVSYCPNAAALCSVSHCPNVAELCSVSHCPSVADVCGLQARWGKH